MTILSTQGTPCPRHLQDLCPAVPWSKNYLPVDTCDRPHCGPGTQGDTTGLRVSEDPQADCPTLQCALGYYSKSGYD